MPIYESFRKDWDKTKVEMEKVGGKKPAEVKTFNLFITKIEKRVSSGIGDALKDLDKAEPKDPKNPKKEEITKFHAALVAVLKASKTEIGMIESEVEKLRGEDGKVDKERKDGYYRALKVFKAKLDHYASTAQLQLAEYQQAMDKTSDEGDKQVDKFKLAARQRLTAAALAVKQINVNPTADSYANGIDDIKRAFVENRSESAMVAGWFQSKRDTGDFQEGTFDSLYQQFNSANSIGRFSTPEEVKTATSALGKLIKQSIETLARVRLPEN